MNEIDECDLLGFLRVRAWALNSEKRKAAPRRRYIDEVWPSDKPKAQT